MQGEPIRFGADGEHGVRARADGDLSVAGDREDLVVHDAHRADPR